EMIRIFGDEYQKYRVRIPMFIPKIGQTEKR
ncbi:MAG TPA: isoprenylcysteine carboxyl methyltransferase, partial [Nitrospiraceae bacterium]|nr:isoprenylcysteine carboxyl methyltransferase [Nitrospiraceae bacterium]